MASLYDRADIYDLGFNDDTWAAVKEHWRIALEGAQIREVLDVSVGSGMVTLPLGELGCRLCGAPETDSM